VGKNITRSEYSLISTISDEILQASNSMSQIVAINDLHITRVSSNKSSFPEFGYKEKRYFNFFLRAFKNILFFGSSFISSLIFNRSKATILYDDSKIDFLFISHYTARIKSKKYEDSYFGDTIKKLQANGQKCFVAYINHTKNSSPFILEGNISSTVLKNHTSFFNLIKIYRSLWLALAFLNNLDSTSEVNRALLNAKINAFSPSTIRNLIFADQIGGLVKQLSPKIIITTYEGHAWERLAFYYARKAYSDVKCVAYQHAPIFKYQHAIRRGIGNGYDPDIILTSGFISAKQLKKHKKLKNSKIFTLGSGRYLDPHIEAKGDGDICLVAPEGTIYECNILFSFALRCANENKNIKFIFRFPPMINMNLLKKHNKVFLNLPSNVSISDRSLSKDIYRSSMVLYRGSSVVIQCVVFGLKPIYLKVYGELTIDPLYEVKDGRVTISNTNEFYDAVVLKFDTSVKEKLVEYCSNMYTQLNISVLEKILSSCD